MFERKLKHIQDKDERKKEVKKDSSNPQMNAPTSINKANDQNGLGIQQQQECV
jgi:hypothetical protein